MAEEAKSNATGWIVALLVAILLVLLWQGQSDEPAQMVPTPQPSEEPWEIDPQIRFKCSDLHARIENADARASAATNFDDQSRWYNKARELEARYLSACNDYDVWMRSQ